MAITNDTEFNLVHVLAASGVNNRYISGILLYLASARVEQLRPINTDPIEGWDTTSDEFAIVKDAIDAGTATYRYRGPNGVIYSEDTLPLRHQWMKTANPLEQARTAEQEVESTDSPPSSLVVYKASVSAPTEDPPDWSETNNTWPKWRAAIEAAGFSVDEPDTTGEEVVWTIKARYARTDGDYECTWDSWRTDGTLYTTDNGATWTTTVPNRNTLGLSQVTHIRRYNVALGEWEEEPHAPQYQGVTGVNLSVLERSAGTIGSGTRYFYGTDSFPRRFQIRGIQVGKTTHVGFRLLLRSAWNSEPYLRGYVEFPIDLIPLTAPHEVEDSDVVVPVSGRTLLVRMDEGGDMHVGQVNAASRLTDYFGDEHRFTCYFRSNAHGALATAATATDTEVHFDNRPDDITAGSILYVGSGATQERMHVQSVNRTQQTHADGHTYYALDVARHPAGHTSNPGRAHAAGTKVTVGRPTVTHEYLVITGKANLHAASEIYVWRIADQ